MCAKMISFTHLSSAHLSGPPLVAFFALSTIFSSLSHLATESSFGERFHESATCSRTSATGIIASTGSQYFASSSSCCSGRYTSLQYLFMVSIPRWSDG